MTYFNPDIDFWRIAAPGFLRGKHCNQREKRKAPVRGRSAQQKEMTDELPGPIRPRAQSRVRGVPD
jgi:hypothetical protein